MLFQGKLENLSNAALLAVMASKLFHVKYVMCAPHTCAMATHLTLE